MQCKVHPTGGPIKLVGPDTHQLFPSGGDAVDVCEYRLEGATFAAVPREGEVLKVEDDNVKKEVTGIPNGTIDLLHLYDLMLLEVGPEYIRKVELHIGGLFIAEGVLDKEQRTVNFFKSKLAYPMAATYYHKFEIWTYHTCKGIVPTYAISGCCVRDDAEREKLKSLKINILFTYAGCDDMNVMTIKEGMVGLRYQRAVFDNTPLVRCLSSAKVADANRAYTVEEMEEWLNANYIYTPDLPMTIRPIES